jgi:uncharacterized protein YacL
MAKQREKTSGSVTVIRGVFVFACVIMGGIWAQYIIENYTTMTDSGITVVLTAVGGLTGGSVALLVLFALTFVTQDIYERLSPALAAIALAMMVGYLISAYILSWMPDAEPSMRVFFMVTIVLIFGYAGIALGLTRASNWESLVSEVKRHQRSSHTSLKLVDTSVIIDGRILDICASGFLEGTLLVPRFVLAELQRIADSSDVLRRAKGRRGLDILKELQGDDAKVTLEIIEDDPKEVTEVDGKLVKLALRFNAKVLTNDFNLNKVAQIEGIEVLNVNDLANAMKPALLPDETMELKIIKEGKEPSQGVGYLDDGTMVVVDNGSGHVGRNVRVIVTSVLQTAAGRMIFTKYNSDLP